MAEQQALPNKVFGITNIKTYVPLILDLERLNYDAWRELFSTHCIGFDVIDHIDESSPKPTDPEWKKVDSIVKLWIYGSISQSLLQMVLKKDSTAIQVWNSLETLFRDNKDAKTMQIDSELRNIVMGYLSVTAYCTKIKALADLLANLDLDSSIPDKHLVIYTINGLSSKFDSVANIIRYRSPLPTFLETRSMLLMEEQRMAQVRPSPPSSHTDHSSSPTILNVTHNGGHRGTGRRTDRRQQPGRRRQQPNTNTPPNRYGWVFIPPPNQHRHQQPQLTSPWQRQSAGLLGPPPHSNQPQRQPPSSAAATWQPPPSTGNTPFTGPSAHLSTAAPSPPWTGTTPDQATALPELFNTMSLNDPGSSDWFMDTGATDHVHANAAIKKIFISSLKRLKLDVSVDKVIDDKSSTNKNANRCLILELASSVVGAASLDLIDLIYNFIRQSLQEEDENVQSESYSTLYRILEKSSGFCSSRFEELMELLLGLKSPADITSLRWRFSCFPTLLIQSIERTSDGENTYGFRLLNQIIVTLKDSKEESRKVAYDILLGMSSSLQKTSSSPDKGPYYEFISMIMGYLSGSSPHIKSGAVSAISLVVYNDSKICNLMPDLVPSILELLHSKAIEVIKAVLGFLKVLVLSLQVRDLQNFLSDILSKLLPWSSVSRHHFKSKVTVILEIIMRKCGSAYVKSLVPEKYRDFVKNVLENRQGKTSSQEAVTTKTEAENSDTTPNSRQKRMPKATGSMTNTKEEHSKEPRKRMRDDKHSSYKPRKFPPRGNTVDRKKEVKRSGKRKSGDLKSDSSGGKRQKQWTNKNTPVS